MGQRLRTYKRVSSARDEDTLASIRTETQDRYGRLPESVEQLFGYARCAGWRKIWRCFQSIRPPDGVALKFSEKARVSPEKLAVFINERADRVFSPTGVLKLKLNEDEQDNLLDTVRGVLLELRLED